MLATTTRRIRPLDQSTLDGNLDGNLDGSLDANLGSGLDDPTTPIAGPAVRRLAPPAGPAPGATQPAEAPGAQAPAPFPTQLPDGTGGVVNVPPASMAPPSVTGGAGWLAAWQGMPENQGGPIPGQLAPPSSPTDLTPSVPVSPPALPPAGDAPGAPTVPAPAPAAPGTFTADDNLIASEVLPGANPRLLNMQGLSDEALQSVLHAPDRLALAKQYLDADSLGLNEQYQHDMTDATNAAGAHGQLGSGMLTNRYGDLFSGITAKKKALETRYLADAAAGTIGDRRAAYDAASGAEGRVFDEGVSDRGEARAERGYQSGLAQQALLNRILQSQAEQGANQQDFQQGLQLYGLGNLNNPEGAYETAAGQASGEAAGGYSAIQQLLAAIMSRRGAQAAAGG